MRRASRLTSSWSGPSHVVACAPHVRHFIVHTRRAGHVVTRPLNCGVRRPRRSAWCSVHCIDGGSIGFSGHTSQPQSWTQSLNSLNCRRANVCGSSSDACCRRRFGRTHQVSWMRCDRYKRSALVCFDRPQTQVDRWSPNKRMQRTRVGDKCVLGLGHRRVADARRYPDT
jgi:hypothetical protein